MDLAVELITDAARVDDDLRIAWRDLAGANALPYATPEWCLAFWRVLHAPGGQLALHVVRDGGRVVGIGPFYGAARQGPLQCPELLTLGAGIGQRTAPLAAPGAEEEVARSLARALAERTPELSSLSLPAIDAAASWPSALADAWPGRTPKLQVRSTSPAPVTTMDDDFASWRAARSRNLRAQLGRSRRAIEERGATTRRSTTPDELEADLAAMLRLHDQRFSAAGRATGLVEHYGPAVAAAAPDLLATGALRLWVIDCGGEVVAAQLHVVAGARMCFWNGGFHPDWQRERPGLLLLEDAVRDAHELGARVLDLGAGASAYKLRFADADEPLAWTSLLVRNRRYPLVRARQAPEQAKAALKDRVATLPPGAQARLRKLAAR